MLELIDEEFQLRVFAYGIPLLAERLQLVGILVEHLQEAVVEVLVSKHRIFLFQSFLHGILDDAVQLPPLGLLVLYVDVGGNDNLVLLKHPDHVLGDSEEGMERPAEGIKAALQSLDHVNTIDTRQHGGDVEGSRILFASLALQELHGSITGIVQALAFGITVTVRRIGQYLHRAIEEVVQATVQLILQFLGRQDVGEHDVLVSQVFLVGRHILDVVAGSAHRHLVYH